MITIKNWSGFQSYKDRRPPWIRLHQKLLDDFEFQSMSPLARATLPMLWLLASEDDDPVSGVIRKSYVSVSFRLRMPLSDLQGVLQECAENGFICLEDQEVTEKLRESYGSVTQRQSQSQSQRTESEGMSSRARGFEIFCKEYPINFGNQKRASIYYEEAVKEHDHQKILEGAVRYAEHCRSQGIQTRFVIHAANWLRDKGWEVEYKEQPSAKVSKAGRGGSAGDVMLRAATRIAAQNKNDPDL